MYSEKKKEKKIQVHKKNKMTGITFLTFEDHHTNSWNHTYTPECMQDMKFCFNTYSIIRWAILGLAKEELEVRGFVMDDNSVIIFFITPQKCSW